MYYFNIFFICDIVVLLCFFIRRLKYMSERIIREVNCNIMGNIYVINFKSDILEKEKKYSKFIEQIKSSGLELILDRCNCNINTLIYMFNNLSAKELILLYNESRKIDSEDNVRLSEFIFNYFQNFVKLDINYFCSKVEADSFIKASNLPMFVNQESEVIYRIKNAVYFDLFQEFNKDVELLSTNSLTKKRLMKKNR